MNNPLDLFIEEMGATLSVVLKDQPPWKPHGWMLAQSVAYDVAGEQNVAPYEWSRLHGKVIQSSVCFVWDRPSPVSAGHRTLLRRMLAGLGLDPTDCAHVWCWPYAQQSPPLPTQVAMYRKATVSAIAASGARYVILVGLQAVHVWRPELSLEQVRNKFAVMENQFIVYPIYNPIVPLSDQTLMHAYREGLREFVDAFQQQWVLEGFGTLCAMGKECWDDYTTTSSVYAYDPDGVPWCRDHWRKNFKRRLDHRAKMDKRVNTAPQGVLL